MRCGSRREALLDAGDERPACPRRGIEVTTDDGPVTVNDRPDRVHDREDGDPRLPDSPEGSALPAGSPSSRSNVLPTVADRPAPRAPSGKAPPRAARSAARPSSLSG
jgi:hypothetical protein